jgi:hypothetical protein
MTNIDITRCKVPNNTTLDSELLHLFVNEGCGCDSLHAMSRDTISVHCDPFPVNHPFYIEFGYCFMFALLVVVAIGSNACVAWIILKHERMRTVSYFKMFLKLKRFRKRICIYSIYQLPTSQLQF